MNAKPAPTKTKQQMRFNKGAKVEVAQTGIVGVVKEGYFLREGNRNLEAYSVAVEMDTHGVLKGKDVESFYGSTLVAI